VTVLLDRRVRWQVRMSGGATRQLLDLRGARLSGVDLAAGAARIELVLPVPDRAVPIRMAGGATEFTLRVPRGVAAAVRVDGGAGTTEVDGVRRTGLAAGTRARHRDDHRPVRRGRRRGCFHADPAVRAGTRARPSTPAA
jgi:hypothetical protein